MVVALWPLTFLSTPLFPAVSLDMPTLMAVVAFYVSLWTGTSGIVTSAIITWQG